MAKGAQDYYQIVDITAQTIARIATRPTYGGAIGTYAAGAIANGVNQEMIGISGQGILYGGYVKIWSSVPVVDLRLYMKIDGNSVPDIAVDNINKFNISKPCGFMPILMMHDDVNHYYSYAINGGLTFETTFSYYLTC